MLNISTNRYISAALLKNKVKVWGELQSDINIEAKAIACGSKFLIVGLSNEVLVWGTPSYDISVQPTQLVSIGSVSLKALSAGLAHGLVLDTSGNVYSYGCGDKGELGLGEETKFSPNLTKVNVSNASNVLCHGQISVAVGVAVVHIWGHVNPELLENTPDVLWTPKELTLPFNILSAGIGGHELMVLCEDFKFYVWEWSVSKRFKKAQENYQKMINIRNLALGRSMQIFLQGVLIPQLTQVISCPAVVPSREPFTVEIQLFDQFGPVDYKSPSVSLYFSIEKTKQKASDIEFDLKIFEGSTTVLEITPKKYGKYWMHILINESEINDLKFLDITPTQDELDQKMQEEEKKIKKIENEKEKNEKNSKIEIEKKKALEIQEENARKKKEETDKRAQVALKSHREKQEKERELEEKERKQKLEMKTGGGYDLKKKKAK